MPEFERVRDQLCAIPELTIKEAEPLASYTRFAMGGPASLFCDASNQSAFASALRIARHSRFSTVVIGGGSNLVVSDSGFDGIVLHFTGSSIRREGDMLHAEAGAPLQQVVDSSIEFGLEGMESMTGVPGSLGGAVYGNAGAYGRAIEEAVRSVTFTDGLQTRTIGNAECEFRYRESIFKRRKEWIVLSAALQFTPGDKNALSGKAAEIRSIRDAKYPPDMKCAGSIFKNVFYHDLPAAVQQEVPAKLVRDGKIPSAWFLEKAGVKGIRRGDIQVAEYHANLIYNDGQGRASDLLAVIEKCKASVRARFGFDLQEEVQYVGFDHVAV